MSNGVEPDDRTMLRRGAIVAAVPVAVTLAILLSRPERFPTRGDEPHYLVMADSLAADRDLDLENNYQRYGLPIVPHVYRQPRGWMPAHGAGLPLLVALPFAAGGALAARAALTVFSGLLALTLFVWFARSAGADLAFWPALAITTAVPVLFGATQIYPDLPGGIIAMALTVWLLGAAARATPARAWPLFWLMTGSLPWLHTKFAAGTLVLVAGGAAVGWKLHRAGRSDEARAALVTLPIAAVGPLLLALFNLWAFGSVIGARHGAELTRSLTRASMIFLGLHLDQSQGMFFCQPLLAFGAAALVPFVRCRPRAALFSAALYASLLAPNAFELARYGLGPADRFAWSAMWLWAIPIGFALARYRAAAARVMRPAALAGLFYQAVLATRWAAAPGVLITRVNPPRDSLFPAVLVRWLPSFYNWDFVSYLYNPVNDCAIALLAAIIAAGALADRRSDVHRAQPL
jgi:hypothetical protein